MVAGINPPLVKLEAQRKKALAKAAELDRLGCWPQAEYFRDQAHFCRVARADAIDRAKRARQ